MINALLVNAQRQKQLMIKRRRAQFSNGYPDNKKK